MGLQLGPPWLVLIKSSNGAVEVLMCDNFTGAAMKRITSARRQEPGSAAAVMSKDGRFATYPDGRVYDPVEETKGRNGGTPAERGHRALLTAQALFREMGGMKWEQAVKPPPGPLRQAGKVLKWVAVAWGAYFLLAALGLV